ncbi:MAG TPA: TlpA disulfide reductase family protein [Chitinophagaceae bacterium]|nr:TlpA disulfide reductase family protein [Chitinophagaceae bacterium]
MIRIIILAGYLLFSIVSESQTIGIGNKIPASIFKDVINYPSPVLKISDFKGKTIIIDFWNHACTACIQSFSKLDSLQKIFAGKIQIILVNRESKDSTKRFFKRMTRVKVPNLPMITGDNILKNLFPIDGYPYTVWIDSNGIVKYFSAEYNVTYRHILDFIKDKELNLRDVTKTKYHSLTIADDLIYFSALNKCNDSIDIGSSEMGYTDNMESVRMTSTCASISELYRKAFREYNRFDVYAQYGLVLEVKDSSKYFYPSVPDEVDEWLANYSFNYELILPLSKKEQRYKVMQEDLKRYFDLEASIEKREVKSIVLRNYCNKKEYRGNQGIVDSLSLDQLVYAMKNRLGYYYPIFDETSEIKKVSIEVNKINPGTLEKLRNELLKSNVVLDIEERKVPVLVIKEKIN